VGSPGKFTGGALMGLRVVPDRSRRRENVQLWASIKVEEIDPEEHYREYSALCRTWGSLGGRETLRRYGREHFRRLAISRWKQRRQM
jgi:hypothetical protein